MAAKTALASDPGKDATVFDRLDEIVGLPAAALASDAENLCAELLATGEATLVSWLVAQGKEPTGETSEGFRLLALHRQGARGDPSFNACRETCRELVYRQNCARAGGDAEEIASHLRLAAMVARHLLLFIDGKLESAGFGEFCCSSKTLRLKDAVQTASANA